MRESPWHLRLPSTEHFQWFKNLIDLHKLTLEWLKEAPPEKKKPGHRWSPTLSREVSANLWILDSICETPLEQLLDDTSPQDMLGRLEYTIWAVQASSLSNTLQERTDTALEQASWKLGKKCSEHRWNELTQSGSQDLRDVLLSLNDSPFVGYPRRDGFLVRRALANEIHVELRSCPHQIHYPEVKPAADRLCRLHTQWMSGFSNAINPRSQVELIIQAPRCIQRWHID